MTERRVSTHRRGTVEYRVRWRRGPAYQGWKTRLFQEETAAKNFAAFLVREKPTYAVNDGYGGRIVEEIAPVVECVIQIREVGPWSDTEIDPKQCFPAYKYRRAPEWP